MSTERWWNDTDRKNPDARRKTGPSSTFSTINPTYTGAGSNPCSTHRVLRLLCCHTTGPYTVFRPKLDFLRHGSNSSLVPVDTHPAQCVLQHNTVLWRLNYSTGFHEICYERDDTAERVGDVKSVNTRWWPTARTAALAGNRPWRTAYCWVAAVFWEGDSWYSVELFVWHWVWRFIVNVTNN